MASTAHVTGADARAKQPCDISGVSDLGLEQVVIEVVARTVEKQADVNSLAAGRRLTVTGSQAK
ncbi:hypothetical protein D3C78_1862180 [compost metagenome]